MKSRLYHMTGHRGFTIIEIAIVMVIIGLLAGAGTSLVGTLTHRKARNETQEYLSLARQALISYASNNGSSPRPRPTRTGP